VRIRLLGGFWVSVGSRPIEEGDWRLRKAKSLVKLLALASNHRVHRERIMDALWPELDREDQTNNLRQARYAARWAFELVPAASSRYLHLKNEEIVLYPDGTL
jgi:DNA-binding SARP family transcriptional activator